MESNRQDQLIKKASEKLNDAVKNGTCKDVKELLSLGAPYKIGMIKEETLKKLHDDEYFGFVVSAWGGDYDNPQVNLYKKLPAKTFDNMMAVLKEFDPDGSILINKISFNKPMQFFFNTQTTHFKSAASSPSSQVYAPELPTKEQVAIAFNIPKDNIVSISTENFTNNINIEFSPAIDSGLLNKMKDIFTNNDIFGYNLFYGQKTSATFKGTAQLAIFSLNISKFMDLIKKLNISNKNKVTPDKF